MARDVLRIVLEVVIATALTVVFCGLFFWLIRGDTPTTAFFDRAIPLGLGFIDIGIVTWLVLLIAGTVRRRGIGWGFGGSLVAALIGTIVNLIWIVILSAINGGVDGAAILLGVQAGIAFLISVTLAGLLVRRVILRP